MAKEGTGTSAGGQNRTAASGAEAPASNAGDAIALLKEDHRQVEQLFAQYDQAGPDQKRELVRRICKALTIHAMIEEELFYPACRVGLEEEDLLDDAQVEHDSAKLLIAGLEQGAADDRYRDAKVRVLAEQVKHHVAEEEKARQGIFAKAAQKGLNTPELGLSVKRRKTELEGRNELPPGRLTSIKTTPRGFPPQAKETDMPNQQTRERDDRGRFMEDDDRGYSSRGSSRDRDDEGRFTSGRRGSSRDDDDDRSRGRDDGRGWYGDSRGHSEAARRGWDDRDRGRSSSRDDDDRSYRSRSSGRDDDDRGGRGRGGWFGDPEGHSEASRRGWDDRGSSRSSRDDDDDDRRRFSRGRDDDDDRGRSSRGRDDDDDRGRGRGGWFGDPEGHSEAARRGWDDRGSSRSSRSSRDDDDDRRRSSRGRNDDDDDRSRGRGGWFGDSRGHSEASRRGWEDRR